MSDLIVKYRKKIFGNDLKSAVIRITVFVLLVLFYIYCGCPIRWLLGLACPGCGMTRAAFSCLRLDFAAAWHFHPLIFLLPIFVLLLYLFRKNDKTVSIISVCFVVILFTVYIIRMSQGGDVVYFHPHDSVIFKIINLFNH